MDDLCRWLPITPGQRRGMVGMQTTTNTRRKEMTDQEIEKRFRDMHNTIASLELMLAQTMTIAVQNSKDPEAVFTDLQVCFAQKMADLGLKEGHPSFESGARVFTCVKTSALT
ncbi:hypothetical protein GCM10022421_32360 [Oceanisphaera sediminis]|uniref:Uncharacterized protein n=1 Tax=Oceanisphaera sediminis TaxID=981381 RepID=A0ABP7EN11_9GAMM